MFKIVRYNKINIYYQKKYYFKKKPSYKYIIYRNFKKKEIGFKKKYIFEHQFNKSTSHNLLI